MANRLGRLTVPAAIFLTFTLSGCVNSTANPAQATAKEAVSAATAALGLSGTDCIEGGFQAVYPGSQKYAGYWESADPRQEYGSAASAAGPTTATSSTASANVHNGIKCKTATLDGKTMNNFIFGYVGEPIKAPAFDPGGADFELIASWIGFQNGTIYDALDASTTARLSRVYDAQVTYYGGTGESTPISEAFVQVASVDNGKYLSYSPLEKYRDYGPRTVRVWWTVPADGSKSHLGAHLGPDGDGKAIPEGTQWNPVYFDYHTGGGTEWATPVDPTKNTDVGEVGCHMGVPDHGPQGGACQPTHTTVWHHKSLDFTIGHVFKDVVLDKYWFH